MANRDEHNASETVSGEQQYHEQNEDDRNEHNLDREDLPEDESNLEEKYYDWQVEDDGFYGEDDGSYDDSGYNSSFSTEPAVEAKNESCIDHDDPNYWHDPDCVPRPEVIWPQTGYTLVDTPELLASLLDTIEGLVDKVLWMDLEGNNLGGAGTLSVLQLFLDTAAQRRFLERNLQFAQATQKAEETRAAEEADRKVRAEEEAKAKAAGKEYFPPGWDVWEVPEDPFQEQRKANAATNANPPTEGHTYLVDVTVLKDKVFSTPSTSGQSTFKALLEDPAVPKAFWDCRSDSEALYWLYGVALQGVLDMQLIECLGRAKFHRNRIGGYARCLGEELRKRSETEWVKADKAKAFFKTNKDYSVFDQRPLSQGLIDYSRGDVVYLPFLFNAVSNRLVTHHDWPHGPIPPTWKTFRPAEYFSQPLHSNAWEIVRQSANRIRLSQQILYNRDKVPRELMTLSPWPNPAKSWEDQNNREEERARRAWEDRARRENPDV